jgi:hypothetical protein
MFIKRLNKITYEIQTGNIDCIQLSYVGSDIALFTFVFASHNFDLDVHVKIIDIMQ